VKLLDIQALPRRKYSDSILTSIAYATALSWTTLFLRSSARLDSKNGANTDTASSNVLAAGGYLRANRLRT
jgi:hypothetical protein